MSFTVDPALVSELVALGDTGLRLRPPAGWVALPPDQLDSFAASRSAEDEPAPVAAFARPADNFALIVSQTVVEDDEIYLADLRAADPSVKVGRFRVNGVAVTQYLLGSAGVVDVRLVTDARDAQGRRVQIDYVVPLARWAGQARVVESSMGTLEAAGG